MNKAVDRLIPRHDRADQDDEYDQDAGDILDAAVSIGNVRVGLRRASTKAIQSGIAVVASPKLWMVSASSAMLPDTTTTSICKAAVTARITNDHLIAQMPRSVVAIVGSIVPCECGWRPSGPGAPCASL